MSENLPGSLGLEQQLKLESPGRQVKDLPLDQLQVLAVEITRQQMVKDNLIQHMFRGVSLCT